jgi:hypothetical protein
VVPIRSRKWICRSLYDSINQYFPRCVAESGSSERSFAKGPPQQEEPFYAAAGSALFQSANPNKYGTARLNPDDFHPHAFMFQRKPALCGHAPLHMPFG